MADLELTGVRADLPIGAMAAFGLLRICERVYPSLRPRLGWRVSGSSFHAVLKMDGEMDRKSFVAALLNDVPQQTNSPALIWTEQLKNTSRNKFVDRAKQAAGIALPQDRAEADWLAAFGTEFGGEEGLLETTVFDMSVARQKFPSDALKLASFLATSQRGKNSKSQIQDFEEALFGPWTYTDDQHSFGWDPTTMKLGAYSHQAPTKLPNSGVRAVVWFAFESLPLFPCFYDHGLSLRAFRRGKRNYAFYWAVWRGFISLSGLKSLLGWPGLFDMPNSQEEADERGIAAVYRSERFKPNKYLASFRPPDLVYSNSQFFQS
jgi:hypothetical protein